MEQKEYGRYMGLCKEQVLLGWATDDKRSLCQDPTFLTIKESLLPAFTVSCSEGSGKNTIKSICLDSAERSNTALGFVPL